VAQQRRRGRPYGWRRPPAGEAVHFEVLVSMRWTLVGLLGAAALGSGLVALPQGRRRRAFGALALAGAASGLIAAFEGIRGAAFPELRHVDLPIQDLPEALDGFRIGQLSDLHYGVPLTPRSVRLAVAAVRDARPDVIVFTGDFISFTRHLPALRRVLKELQAPHGVFAIWGNHDYWTDLAKLDQLLRELGITPLINEHRVITSGGAALVIAGVDDIWEGDPNLDGANARTGLGVVHRRPPSVRHRDHTAGTNISCRADVILSYTPKSLTTN